MRNVKIVILLVVISAFLLAGALWAAKSTAQDKVDFIHDLFAARQEDWPKMFNERGGLIDSELLRLLEKFGDDAWNQQKLEHAWTFFLLADRCAVKLKVPQNYRLKMAKYFIEKKDANAALEILQNILIETKNSHLEALLLKGQLLESGGYYSAANECYARVIEIAPKNVEGYLRKGRVHFRFGEAKIARSLFDKVLSLDPGNREAPKYLAAIKAGKTTLDPQPATPSPSAVPSPSPAPSSSPSATPSPAPEPSVTPAPATPSPTGDLNFILPPLAASSKNAEAVEQFRKGEDLRLSGKPAEALDAYRAALAQDLNFVEAHFAVGYLYYRDGDIRRALPEITVVTQLTDRYSSAFHLLGMIYEKAYEEGGDKAYIRKAYDCYKTAVKLDSSNGKAKEDVKRVKKLQR